MFMAPGWIAWPAFVLKGSWLTLLAESVFLAPLWEHRWYVLIGGLLGLAVLTVGLLISWQRMKEALRQSLKEQTAWFDLPGVGQSHVEPYSGRFLHVNPTLCQMLGYSERELLGKTVAEITHPEDRAESIEGREALIRGEIESLSLQKRYIRKDGTVMWGVVAVAVVRDAKGRPLHTVSVVQDITQRKLAEEALRKAAAELERRVAERTAELRQANEELMRQIAGRQEAEAGRLSSTQRVGEILENIGDAYLSLDATGKILKANHRAELILGKKVEQMIGQDLEAVLPAGLCPRLHQEVRRATAERSTAHLETYCPAVSRWLEYHCYSAPEGLDVYFRDIGQRKAAEMALRTRARQQEAVAHLGQLAIAETNLQKLLEEAAEVLCQTMESDFCVVLRTVENERALELVAASGWKEEGNGKLKVAVDEQTHLGYTWLRREPVVVEEMGQDKRFRGVGLGVKEEQAIVSGVGVAIPNQKPQPFGVVGSYSTQRRTFTEDDLSFLRAVASVLAGAIRRTSDEDALRYQRALLETQAETMIDGFLAVSPDRRVLNYNRRFQEIWGLPDEVMATGSDEALLEWKAQQAEDARDFARLPEYLWAHPDEVGRDELRLKNGRVLERYSSPLKGAEGTNYGRIVFVRDVTQQKMAEEQRRAREAAEAANRAKDQFLAMLSHELRTPLMPVLASTMALEQRPDLPQEVREDLAMVRRNIELQARLIDDMLDVTRIARGKMELKLAVVDAHEVIHQSLEKVKDEAVSKGLELCLELEAPRTFVGADAGRLQQVFWNLVKNAIKFTPPGGRITVRSSNPSEETLRVEVIDTGMGIEPRVLPRLFEAFEQGERDVTRQYGGLGLGLTISKGLVEMHGGRLSASSAGRGKGATFTVELSTLPEEPEARPPELPAPAEERGGLRILLVEDHEDTLQTMGRLLRSDGHQMTLARTKEEAIQAAKEKEFDLVISDLGLPDGSGLDLMRQLKAEHQLKGVALSGYGMTSDMEQSHEAGFEEHLVKPVNVEKLEEVIERVGRKAKR